MFCLFDHVIANQSIAVSFKRFLRIRRGIAGVGFIISAKKKRRKEKKIETFQVSRLSCLVPNIIEMFDVFLKCVFSRSHSTMKSVRFFSESLEHFTL